MFFFVFFRCVYCIQVWCVCVWNSPIKKKKYWERESEAACVCVCVCVDLVGSFWLSVCVCVRDPPPPLRTPPKGKEGGERERERGERECDQYVGKTETRVVCSCCIVVSTAAVLSHPTRFAASSKASLGLPSFFFFFLLKLLGHSHQQHSPHISPAPSLLSRLSFFKATHKQPGARSSSIGYYFVCVFSVCVCVDIIK